MLKRRIIPTMLYSDFGLVKGEAFNSWRRTGSVIQTVKIYNMRNVDELVFFDIKATEEGREPDYQLIHDIADECFMPFSVGGGIKSVEQIRKVLLAGADKVVLNTVAIENPSLIQEASQVFGNQCIIVSLDVKKIDGEYEVFIHSGKKQAGITLADAAKLAQANGAGELLVTSIERDGTLGGYDHDLLEYVVNLVDIPVIGAGGAKDYNDMKLAFEKSGIDALASAAMYHFTEQTPNEAKAYLKAHGINVRI
ncbi:TPA: imidazole glycerol phosphate synthase subunit HisF [Vibrio vulnificus]|nr:imidazole glycerol phosphate synthase subunit HisF [Vibrio vulnificus]ELC9718223.1 imidazole glycerol phosphate synthase subunit HisF [Vibrio vulnificus]ELS0762114.1 imidazole glycerol phosphate synthase subunit HisF [Vibrio vulnificus]ELV8609347.1 imidazole glycerol phosphate synthase subunit HisF [Vibrio vulnificus]ELV8618349.1 imidazole glycerol phosphate synthase subunit HisF [Vibrio vulnificus]